MMNKMQYAEIANQIFDAIDIIVDKKLEALAYDRCIVAKVTGISDSNLKEYFCSYQDAIFKAIFNDKNRELEIDSFVYVLVPQNNFQNKKFIIGLAQGQYKEIENQPIPPETDDDTNVSEEELILLKKRVSLLESFVGYQQDADETNDIEIIIDGNGISD